VSGDADASGAGSEDAPVSQGRVRAILGPTGAGKSALALAVAEGAAARGEPHEIVAVDAFTVYRGMDVGTAKPSPAERARVRHHLVDVLDPSEDLTVVRFRDLARAAIADVHARGATALLVGGSGLYWRAVVDGLTFPPTDPATRAAVEARLGGDAEAAHAELSARDPAAAARIPVRNLRRVVRALEVLELTGRPFSSWDDAWGGYSSVYRDLDVVLLDPADDVLRAAIRARADAMVAGGLIDEERRLASAPRSRTAAAGIGYAEAAAVLRVELDPADLAAVVAARTRRYARRQRAWFRADPRCVATAPDDVLRRWVG
jgi:tRNA dimethylallyltransferase